MEYLTITMIENILVILVTLFTGFIVAYLHKKLGVEGVQKVKLELELKQELAKLAVKFIEQVYRDYDGREKYALAALWISDRAKELGININEDEIKGLVESILRTFKDEFGERWADIKKGD